MKKTIISIAACLLMLFGLSGCSAIGNKAASISIIYGVTAALSLLLAGYCLVVRKRESWFILLFTSVAIVNVGYFTLSVSKTIDAALFANRIAYFGSVFLPLAMLMIILNTVKLSYKKWLPIVLIVISILVFLVTASPGYLDIYYKSVSLEVVNGATVLQKEYGPWHSLYLYYLVLYFASMVVTIIYATAIKKLASAMHATILAASVFVNIVVWLLEQLVYVEFEILSISYIITELFLLGLHMMVQENEKRLSMVATNNEDTCEMAPVCNEAEGIETSTYDPVLDEPAQEKGPTISEQCSILMAGLPGLTQTEHAIYDYYVEGKSTKEIMSAMNITENTLKYHNKNIYGKLGVSSRKQMMNVVKAIKLAEIEGMQ